MIGSDPIVDDCRRPCPHGRVHKIATGKASVGRQQPTASATFDASTAKKIAPLVDSAHARAPGRLKHGATTPMSEQDPALWRRPLIEEADDYPDRALTLDGRGPRLLQAAIHAAWCQGTTAWPNPGPDAACSHSMISGRRSATILSYA
jgi:hypothetical protein